MWNLKIVVLRTTVPSIGCTIKGISYDVYYIQGVYVETFYIDREFEYLRRIIPRRSALNKTDASEHVPEIERQIKVMKELVRSIWITLTYNKVPGQIFIEIIFLMVMCLNAFLPVVRVSQTYSQRNIM